MIVEIKKEDDKIEAGVSFTPEELRASFTNPLKYRIMLAINDLIHDTLSDLYSIILKEEEQ